MNKLKTNKILVPFDFSKTAGNAIKYAAFTAKLTKGELILLHVQRKNELVDIIMPAINLKDISVITEYIEAKLEKVARDISKHFGIKVTALTSIGNIPNEIATIAEDEKCGLIVMGTRGKDSQNDMFMGSNAYHTITKSDFPVMTVQKAADKLGFSRIVLPMDLSAHSRQKVDSAIYLAGKFASRIFVIGLLHKYEMQDKYKLELVLEQIKKMSAKKNIVAEGIVVQSDNHAMKTIAYARKVKGQLIISMNDQDTEFARSIVSTYVHQLVNDSKIPVLCIPPDINGENMNSSIGGMW